MTETDIYKVPALGESPWLIGTRVNPETGLNTQAFCTVNNKSYIKEIAELDGKSILASCQGWLILRERANRGKHSLWNPVTLQNVLLPEMLDPPDEKQLPTCILTAPPGQHDDDVTCVLLVFFHDIVFSCWPMAKNDCRWVKKSLSFDGETVFIKTAATLKGDIYVYTLNSKDDGSYAANFSRLKLIDDGIVFEPLGVELPDLSIKFTTYMKSYNYLVELGGDLYSVHLIPRQLHDMDDYDIFKAFVWRLDLFLMEWVQVESLGDRALLLGDNCCTWCWPSPSAAIEGNCHYVANQGCQILHQYRLQDDSYTLLLTHPDFNESFDGPFWFVPYNCTRLLEDRLVTKITEDNENIKHVYLLEEMMNLEMVTNSSFPLFMSLKNTKGLCEIWDSCLNISHTIKTPHLPGLLSTIEFCKDGWLLLRIEGHHLEYTNLFTGKRAEYPPNPMTNWYSSFAFSTCPASPDCLTIGIDALGGDVHIGCIRAGNKDWERYFFELDPVEGNEFESSYNSSPKYHDGAFYVLSVNGNLGVFQMLEGNWSWKVYRSPLTDDQGASLNSSYLAELDGKLICVYIGRNGESIRVFEFVISHKGWVEVNSLGDHMLFVSAASSFSVLAKDSKLTNKIYLPKRIGNEVVFYSLNTHKYHTSGCNDSKDDFYGMSSQSFSCWL